MPTRIQFRRDTAANWESTNPALAAGELGFDTTNGRFKIGNGNTAWTSLPYTTNATAGGAFTSYASRGGEWKRIRHATGQGNPTKFLRMVTTRPSSNAGFAVVSSSGYAAALWWDGSVTIGGTGSTSAGISFSKAVPTSGNWSGSSPKEMFAWPCLSSGSAALSTNATFSTLNLANSSLSLLEFGGIDASYIYAGGNTLRFFDGSDCPSLHTLNLSGSPLQEVDLTGCDALTFLTMTNSLLSGTVDLSGFPSLASVTFTSNVAVSRLVFGDQPGVLSINAAGNGLETVDIEGLTNLSELYLPYNNLTSVYVNSGSDLTTLNLIGNQLTSVRCPGATFGGWSNTYYQTVGFGCDISDNQLSASALNQFYTDLGPAAGDGGYINVDANPGTSGDNSSIATAKGYTVYGT